MQQCELVGRCSINSWFYCKRTVRRRSGKIETAAATNHCPGPFFLVTAACRSPLPPCRKRGPSLVWASCPNQSGPSHRWLPAAHFAAAFSSGKAAQVTIWWSGSSCRELTADVTSSAPAASSRGHRPRSRRAHSQLSASGRPANQLRAIGGEGARRIRPPCPWALRLLAASAAGGPSPARRRCRR
jgi:hypothetical protein